MNSTSGKATLSRCISKATELQDKLQELQNHLLLKRLSELLTRFDANVAISWDWEARQNDKNSKDCRNHRDDRNNWYKTYRNYARSHLRLMLARVRHRSAVRATTTQERREKC